MQAIGGIGKWAWLVAALAALPFVLWAFSQPDPTDRPLNSGALAAAAGPILVRAGVAETPIVVRQGVCASGTVAGLYRNQRIVITPAVVKQPRDGALWAVAHEAAHVRHHDPLLGVLVGWAWVTLSLGLAQALTRRAVRPGRRWGLLAFPLGLAVGFALGAPAFNLIQRQVERRADRFGVAMTGNGAAAAAFVAQEAACLGASSPRNLIPAFLGTSHDPAPVRIEMLRTLGSSTPLASARQVRDRSTAGP